MKRASLSIYLLLFSAIFVGCFGSGFVLESMSVMALNAETGAAAGNIFRPFEANQLEASEIDHSNIDYIEEIAAITQNANPDHAAHVQSVQAEIFEGFANFSIGNLEMSIMRGDVTPNPVEYTIGTIQEVEEPVEIAGHIAITFDDGPHPTLTPLLLDALYARNIRATFFLLGAEVDRNPDIVARMYEEGHSIGNHSYRHTRFTGVNRQRIVYEIESTNRSIEAVTGSVPTLLRPPYGARNNTVLDVARQMDMSVVLWSVDPRDWDHRNAPVVRDNILNVAVDGSVVLLHDIHATSIEAAIMAIDALVDMGYVFVTVEELFHLSEMTLQAGGVYLSIYHSTRVSQ
ncbi:MAG: polysaccharide deacetylase family protein [Clostridiales bacterium]|jgi:peptidoglycan/xylan/chitin deacetylase (PgdA/CDA1 family)|nr:polysaccharide deacetylase family protein [Clostridiales bacterium]